jgi:metal-dependent amidase/aminoacylase/carboxypeptidase family protein
MTFEATIRFEDSDMNDVIEEIVKKVMFEDTSFANTIAGEIDVDDVAQVVANETDWDDISDAIHDKIRDNNLEEIAKYISDDVADVLSDNEQFCDLLELEINKVVGESLTNKIEEMSKTINSQAMAISHLTKSMNAMQTKKFWKKLWKK